MENHLTHAHDHDHKANKASFIPFLVGMVVANLLFHTVPEIFEDSDVSLPLISLFVLFGIGFQYALHRFLTPAKGIGNQFLTFLHIHNITDGFVIGLAMLVNLSFGLFAALGILLHDIIHKTIGFQFLRRQGDSAGTASVKIASTFVTIIIAALLTMTLKLSDELAHLGGAFAAGSLAYVSFLLLKEVYLKASETLPVRYEHAFKTAYLVIGALVMLGLFMLLGQAFGEVH